MNILAQYKNMYEVLVRKDSSDFKGLFSFVLTSQHCNDFIVMDL
jgi:hypothetical protein